MAAHCPEFRQQLDRQALRQGFRWSALQEVQIDCPSCKTTLEITPGSVSLIAAACCLLAIITIPGMLDLHQRGRTSVCGGRHTTSSDCSLPIIYVLLSGFNVKRDLSIR